MRRKGFVMTGSRWKKTATNIHYLGDHQDLIPLVAGWIYQEWFFLYPGKTKRYIESLLQERVHKKKLPLTLVAFRGGKPVGTVSIKEFDIEERTDLTPWITSLYVVKRARGKGIGSDLMEAAEQKAAGLGIGKLYLLTADTDLAARFYSPRGWTLKEKKNYRSYSLMIMEKKVSAGLTAAA